MDLITNAGYALRAVSSVFKLGARAIRGDKTAWDALADMSRAADPNSIPSMSPWDNSMAETRFRPPMLKSSISLYEAMVLGVLVKKLQPNAIFEIGTGDGYSALIMAENSPTNVKILTLDLLDSNVGNHARIDKEAAEETHAAGVGRLVMNNPKVELLAGDSTQFDFTPFENSIDLVFIDGAHDKNTVQRDTESAFKLLRKGGTIIWHDTDAVHNGVFSVVKALAGKLPIKSIQSTRFAVLKNVDANTHAHIKKLASHVLGS